MSLITCPECGREKVSDSAKACPGCGFEIYKISSSSQAEISSENPIIENKKNLSKNKKIILLAVFICIIFWIIWYFSTRCSYDGCYNHVASSGSYCSYHKALYNRYYSYTSHSYDSRSVFDLRISNVEVHKTSSTMYCTGTITNNGDKSFEFVKVKAAFNDKNGNTIETGDSYAVGGEGLSPGESTSFTIYGDKNSDVVDCKVSVYDYN